MLNFSFLELEFLLVIPFFHWAFNYVQSTKILLTKMDLIPTAQTFATASEERCVQILTKRNGMTTIK